MGTHTFPQHVFREYDIRGLAGTELTASLAHALGRALGSLALRHPSRGDRPAIVVGRDMRLSSDELREGLVSGILRTGCDVVDIGLVATPLTYFAAHTLPVDGLCMITGSHNPGEFNGFKLGLGHTTFHGAEVQALRRVCEAGDFVDAPTPGSLRTHDIISEYSAWVRAHTTIGGRPLKVVVDSGNGCGGFIAVPLLRAMGVQVIDQFTEPDGRFPNHHADPTVPANLEALIARVRAEGADVGIAYDGDADRIGAVDELGNILWGDQLLVLFAREILSRKPGSTIVGEVKCSMALYEDIARRGGRGIMWKAGHSLIKAKMAETGAEIAGEMSGHIFFKDGYFGFDDAIYSTVRLLKILASTSVPLSRQLTDLTVTVASPEIRVDCPEHLKFATVAHVKKQLSERGHRLIDVDGVRVEFSDGWGLVRASNTQPILVLRFEATTQPRLDEIRHLMDGCVVEARKQLARA